MQGVELINWTLFWAAVAAIAGVIVALTPLLRSFIKELFYLLIKPISIEGNTILKLESENGFGYDIVFRNRSRKEYLLTNFEISGFGESLIDGRISGGEIGKIIYDIILDTSTQMDNVIIGRVGLQQSGEWTASCTGRFSYKSNYFIGTSMEKEEWEYTFSSPISALLRPKALTSIQLLFRKKERSILVKEGIVGSVSSLCSFSNGNHKLKFRIGKGMKGPKVKIGNEFLNFIGSHL